MLALAAVLVLAALVAPFPQLWQRIFAGASQALREAAETATRRLRQVERSEVTQTLNRLGSALAAEAFPAERAAVADRFQAMLDEAMPRNWRRLGRRSPTPVKRVVELVRETGWSLARTPPTEVPIDLLDAPDVEAQERVLATAETMIVEELDPLLCGNQSPSFPDVHAAAVGALAAYSSGYFVASQALSTLALTSVVHNHSRPARLKAVRIALKQFHPDKDGLRLFRFASVMRALGTALDEWWHTHPPRE